MGLRLRICNQARTHRHLAQDGKPWTAPNLSAALLAFESAVSRTTVANDSFPILSQ